MQPGDAIAQRGDYLLIYDGERDGLAVGHVRAPDGTDHRQQYVEAIAARGYWRPVGKVAKHGNHNQKDHGRRFASSVSPEVAAKAIRLVGENGGLSIRLTDGSEPADGYMVARDSSKFGTVVPASEFYDPDRGPAILSEHLIRNRSELGSGRAFLGAWHQKSRWLDDGTEVPLPESEQVVHLDVTDQVASRSRAVSLGRRRNQISIWDVANFDEIPTGGTGGAVAKREPGRSRLGDPQASDGDDRRRDSGVGSGGVGGDDRRHASVVVKFAPGLRPVIKHGDPSRPGYAQQHPNGAGGQYAAWGDRAREIEGMSLSGPSADALETMLANGSIIDDDSIERDAIDYYADEITMEADARTMEILESRGISEDDIAFELTYERVFDDVQSEVAAEYIAMYRESAVDGALTEGRDSWNEVYGTSHTGMTRDGKEITLQGEVWSIDNLGGAIQVKGVILTDDGTHAGQFEREFRHDRSGKIEVEHVLLQIEPEYQGTGFSQAFNRNAENYYISHGIEAIHIHAALQVGGYAWAKQGFDWAEYGGMTQQVRGRIERALRDPSLPSGVARQGADIVARSRLPKDDPDHPTAREVASWGWVPGATTWPGKETMLGADWYGVKRLTPSGTRRTSQEVEAERQARTGAGPDQKTLF